MKFFWVVFVLVAAMAGAQALIYTPAATLQWDPVTALDDGVLIGPTDVVTYEVGRSADPVVDRLAPEMTLGTTAATTFPITLPPDGTWYVYAVRAVLTTDDGQTILTSTWNWSDQNGAETPSPFWYRHPAVVPPSVPLGFAGR